MTTLCSTDSSFKSLSKEEYRFECFSAWINIWRQFHHHRFPRGGVFVNFTHLQILTRAELCSLHAENGSGTRSDGAASHEPDAFLLAQSLFLARQIWRGSFDQEPSVPRIGRDSGQIWPHFLLHSFAVSTLPLAFFFFGISLLTASTLAPD